MAGRPATPVVAVLAGLGGLLTGCGGSGDPLPAAPGIAMRSLEYLPPESSAGGPASSPAGDPAPLAGPPPSASDPTVPVPAERAAPAGSDVGPAEVYPFSCGDSEAAVAASGAPHVIAGSGAVYVGAQQVEGDNQDPRVVRFEGGEQVWCRDDLETSGDDGRAYGVLWSGDRLYVVVSAVGTQGEPSGDLRRYTGSGWLTSYTDASPGGGGGAEVSVLVQLDPVTGEAVAGTWLTAVTADGETNSLVVTALATVGGDVVVDADAWYSPRGADGRPLACSGSSPFPTRYTFAPDLSAVVDVRARGCS
ncbi:MAG: hypothetical protein ACFCVG_08910 [Kineosporiaceae bacterium]